MVCLWDESSLVALCSAVARCAGPLTHRVNRTREPHTPALPYQIRPRQALHRGSVYHTPLHAHTHTHTFFLPCLLAHSLFLSFLSHAHCLLSSFPLLRFLPVTLSLSFTCSFSMSCLLSRSASLSESTAWVCVVAPAILKMASSWCIVWFSPSWASCQRISRLETDFHELPWCPISLAWSEPSSIAFSQLKAPSCTFGDFS